MFIAVGVESRWSRTGSKPQVPGAAGSRRPPAPALAQRGEHRNAAAARLATQRDALLDEAAAQFNARGISGVSVNDVAARVGLTRAAVYYYVADREDLVFQCYMRACHLLAEDLARAQEEGADDLGRVEAFVRRVLSPERPPPRS